MLSGCACFSGNNLQQVNSLPPLTAGAKKPTLSYIFLSSYYLWGEHKDRPRVRNALESEFADVIKESGYFAKWGPGNSGDVTIEIHIVLSGNPASVIPAIITGLTLFVIPSWVSDTYIVTAKIKIRDGSEHIFQLEDSTILVQWLPMIVVPGNIFTVPVKVRKNIWKNLILKMQQDGMFTQQSSFSQTKPLLA